MLSHCRRVNIYWRRALIMASSIHMHNGFIAYSIQRHHASTSFVLPTCCGDKAFSTTTSFKSLFGRPTKRYLSDQTDKNAVPGSKRQRPKNPREYILSKNPQPEDQQILESTLDWVQNVVIGLNLCPFAEKPFKSKRMHMEVIHGRDESEIMGRILGECLVKQAKPGTSLMICPDLYPNNFQTFLQVYNMLSEGVLVDNDLTDDVQIAPFHPRFEFDGSGTDGADNYTNRSPYPIFHILREEEVGNAVDILDGDASRVWRRNVKLLESLSKELANQELELLMAGKESSDERVREKIKNILFDLKKKTDDVW